MIYTDKRVFIDTNILVYANDSSDRVKCDIAKQIILNGITEENAIVSTQVLSEFLLIMNPK
ncbi:hypothetical protein GF406_04615 [candidate division KSB1 bacterium]|nr:hypothetical protein [candidate division KSB1 bacterium]